MVSGEQPFSGVHVMCDALPRIKPFSLSSCAYLRGDVKATLTATHIPKIFPHHWEQETLSK